MTESTEGSILDLRFQREMVYHQQEMRIMILGIKKMRNREQFLVQLSIELKNRIDVGNVQNVNEVF